MWYDEHRRELPWRRNRELYPVLLSEIMLQQTRVATVQPRFEQFLERFPSIEELACADEEEVVAEWSGLGYYRRARSLHRAARILARAEAPPRTAAALERLPGVGPYTAAAVASIVYDEVVPVLDGNVERLLCRWLARSEDSHRRAIRQELLQHAAALLDPSRPGDSNQALMELGATVCRPKAPLCDECPLRPSCRGLRAGDPTVYPSPRARARTVEERRVVVVVETRGRILYFRRSRSAEVLAGFWELPWVPASSRDASQALAERYGGTWELGCASRQVRHAITYRRLLLRIHRGRWSSRDAVAEGPEAAWLDARRDRDVARSSMVAKALRAAAELAPQNDLFVDFDEEAN